MLEIKDLTIRLAQTDRILTDKLSFTLSSGDRIAVIGEEGDGKSTLLRYLAEPSAVEAYCECTGTVICHGRVGYLPQFPAAGEQALAAYFAVADARLRAAALKQVGLPAEMAQSTQRFGTLSGGERVKAAIARILMDEPDLLLLDEPTNDLDRETLQWLEGFLLRTPLPVLYISHDVTLIENTANGLLHIEQLAGKTKSRITVARAGYNDYVTARGLLFDKQEQVAKKQRAQHAQKMARWQQIHDRVEHEQRAISRQDPGGGRLLKKKMHTVLAQGRRYEREVENFTDFPESEDAILTKFRPDITLPRGKVVLDMTLPRLTVGERVLARDVRLFVAGASHIGITGRNGVGKSTLLAVIWQQLRDRRDITASYMPQQYAAVLDPAQTPVEYLAANHTRDEVTKARTYMGSMRFTRAEMTGKIGALSGGQQAKLLFLDMVLRDANVLVLDEPTRNFSPLSAPVVRAALRAFGGAIISVSHDRRYLAEVCDQVYVLDENGLREEVLY